ncbi:MAG: hypothetical protein IKZ87_05750 [Actinomycetaceae bacterium]|nr:hypothetical protein [Actinomycetaceae bacterium]
MLGVQSCIASNEGLAVVLALVQQHEDQLAMSMRTGNASASTSRQVGLQLRECLLHCSDVG